MNTETAVVIGKLLDGALVLTQGLADLGINYREVMDEQDAAAAEDRPVDSDKFIAQAQRALNQL